jgi:BirA family transcriptional regulator, biotin operon repressor / biotin---[acetyl-CoA-carboxylase] ligase
VKPISRDHFTTCTSTIDLAKRAIDQPHIADFIPMVITADKQTRGRGRKGDVWFSPEGCGIYAAFVVPLTEYHEFMTMWIGSAIVRELKRYTHLDIKQIGINDLYLDNRKLGGILCEAYKGYLIVGVGLNIFRPSDNKIRKDLLSTIVYLNEFGAEHLLDRPDLINVLAEAIC